MPKAEADVSRHHCPNHAQVGQKIVICSSVRAPADTQARTPWKPPTIAPASVSRYPATRTIVRCHCNVGTSETTSPRVLRSESMGAMAWDLLVSAPGSRGRGGFQGLPLSPWPGTRVNARSVPAGGANPLGTGAGGEGRGGGGGKGTLHIVRREHAHGFSAPVGNLPPR